MCVFHIWLEKLDSQYSDHLWKGRHFSDRIQGGHDRQEDSRCAPAREILLAGHGLAATSFDAPWNGRLDEGRYRVSHSLHPN